MKNTKGKWEIKAPSGMLGVGVVSVYTGYDDKKEVICEISALGDRGKTIANANLIASAPEMLEMVKEIVQYVEGNGLDKMPIEEGSAEYFTCTLYYHFAKDLLAKAEGK